MHGRSDLESDSLKTFSRRFHRTPRYENFHIGRMWRSGNSLHMDCDSNRVVTVELIRPKWSDLPHYSETVHIVDPFCRVLPQTVSACWPCHSSGFPRSTMAAIGIVLKVTTNSPRNVYKQKQTSDIGYPASECNQGGHQYLAIRRLRQALTQCTVSALTFYELLTAASRR